MCLICVEYEKEKLSLNEAFRNLEEMKESVGEEHYDKTKDFLIEEAMNKQWGHFYFGRDVDEYSFEDESWEITGFGD
tara:strand:+ start:7987 stop:8217 length:231 start_codon:yes stop_codon:yes gene_type:complete